MDSLVFQWVQFLMHVFGNPESRAMMLAFFASFFFVLFMVWLILHVNDRYRARILDLEDAVRPKHVYRFSKDGEVRVYGDGVQICRGGRSVSSLMDSVWDIRWNRNPDSRVLRIRHLNPDRGPVTEDVRCGPVDAKHVQKICDVIYHYAGE